MQSRSSRIVSVCLLLVLLSASLTCGQPLRLPKIFGDHMVLQRELPVVVWGWADAGEEVTVSFGAQAKSAKADADGKWRVTLDALKASAKATTMKVRAGDEAIELADVLVGEVWLCSGQSNMEMVVSSCDDAQEEIAKADYPMIRHITIERIMLPEPADDVSAPAGWQLTTPQTAGSFTAAGYFFGEELHQELDVPIGLVNSSWGGSTIEAFVSPDGFKQVPELSAIVDRIESSLPGNPEYEEAVRKTMAETREWLKQAKESLDNDRRVPSAPALPGSTNALLDWADPSNKHNAMINGLVPYRIRGTIWYQGESNHNDGMLYVKKTEALVKGWRKAWGQPDLPHYFVQIAPYQYGEEDPEIMPVFWEAQEAIEKEIPNTGRVVIHDVGDIKDIHPKNKKAVGHRLALLALARTYGRDIVDGGPQFEKMKIEDEKIRVFFKRIGGGLITSDGKSPDYFEIAGNNGSFVAAEAKIEGDSIVLSAAGVQKPVVMRYAWSKLAEPNLRNKEGLPVSAFRSGKVDERAMLDTTVPQAKKYELVYSYDIGAAGTTQKSAAYRIDRSAKVKGFDRVAYFLALQKAGEPMQYVWVSMDPFATQAGKLGVPTASTNVKFQQSVSNMNVRTNVDSVKAGEGLKGSIEFWPHNYGPQNSGGVAGASDDTFDFGDVPGDPQEGYGSMQIHNPSEKQTILAVNRWWGGATADIGIGNSPQGNPDYTFAGNAGTYKLKRLMVLVRATD